MSNSAVEIIPNRNQIDNRFPVLGFTVKTGGLTHYEVLVTTDRKLFAPENAAARNAGNFFSSRQANNQLQRNDGTDSVYIVPASVLNAFAQGEPKPPSIFYTLIAYADETGAGAVFAHSPEALAGNAPEVLVTPGFTGQTLSTVLGVRPDVLQRVETPAMSVGSISLSSVGYGTLEDSDEGEAEDGYALLNAQGLTSVFDSQPESSAEDGYELNQRQANAAISQGYYREAQSHAPDGYEDGFENQYGNVANQFSRAQESIFPEGAAEPDELYDSDNAFLEDEQAFSYREDLGGSYSEPAEYAFEYAGGYRASGDDMKSRKNGHSREAYQVERDEYRDDGEEGDFEQGYGDDIDAGKQGTRMTSRAADAAADAEKKILARKQIVETIGKFESGSTAFKAINADQEFAKWKWHSAYGKYHVGLSYGIVQFTQDGGSLGKLLVMMRGRDKAVFDKTFGGAKLADELIKVTTASGAMSKDVKGGRSARVQPVDGTDIWLSPWRERFEAAGDHAPFQAAQNELANSEYLEPILQFCNWLGLDTDRGIGMVYDRAVNMGVGGARKWVASTVGPVQTPALQQKALTALGKKDLKDFQSSVGLKADGDWGPMSHAAMVSKLRALGTKSPIPIPTREQMMDAMVRAASGKDWEHRVTGLRKSKDLSDTVFTF